MQHKSIFRLAVLATIFASVVVMLGAWTRLVDAGLGCPDWPGCYGFLTVPQSAEHIEIAEARFPDAPVEVEKGWPEMIHRYFASTLGLIIIGLTVLSARAKRRASSVEAAQAIPLKHCVALLALVICQGLFGMWTVTLKLWPQVVSAHLLGGFATLSLLFLLALRMGTQGVLSESAKLHQRLSACKRVIAWGIVVVVAQIFLGAWTASNYAALACGSEFPTCHASLWPEMDLAGGFDFMQSVGPNYLGGLFDNESRVAIHVVHRLGALIVFFYLCAMLLWLWRLAASRTVKLAVVAVAVILSLQIALGISNVIWLVPLPIAVAHNAVGALLLLGMVNLRYQFSRIKQQ